jgi:hypothetical protein
MSLVVIPASPPPVVYSLLNVQVSANEALGIRTESEPQVALLPLTKKGDRLNVENRNQTVEISVSIEYKDTIFPLTIANKGAGWMFYRFAGSGEARTGAT